MQSHLFPQGPEVLPCFYWGDVLWLKYWLECPSTAKLSIVQTYRKQRNFNRAYILGGNGIDILTIPVTYEGMFPKVSEVRISYQQNWQKQHLKKIFYAYKNSAYFEYYWHIIERVYQNTPKYLWEFNYGCAEAIREILQLSDFQITEEYVPKIAFSYRIEETPRVRFPEYFQLFAQKFIPNLSFLDLVMNLGVEAKFYLKNIHLNYRDLVILKKKNDGIKEENT